MQDIKDDDSFNRNAKLLHVVSFGVAIVIGGQFYSWNNGLAMGFYPYLAAIGFMFSGYLCLVLCLAEMVAIFPFSGGTYGLARVTLGRVPAFMLGASETYEYFIFVTFMTGAIGATITRLFEISSNFEPIYWLFIYGLSIFVQMSKRENLWSVYAALAVLIIVLVVLYCLISPAHAYFEKYVTEEISALENKTTSDQVNLFFKYLPVASWFFAGVETLPLTSADALEPNAVIPIALRWTLGLSLITCLGLLFSSCSMYPGIAHLGKAHEPLSYGYSLMFHISYRAAMVFTIIGMYGRLSGYTYSFARQARAMDKSKLILQVKPEYFKTRPLLFCQIYMSLVSYITLLLIWLFNNRYFDFFGNACLLASFLVYIGIFLSYIVFRQKFYTLIKGNRNPFGVFGAVYGICVFIVPLISVIGFQNDKALSVIIYGVFMVWMYKGYYRHRHTHLYSNEERAVLFIAFVMESNGEKRNRLRHKKILAQTKHGKYCTVHDKNGKVNNKESNDNSYRHQQSVTVVIGGDREFESEQKSGTIRLYPAIASNKVVPTATTATTVEIMQEVDSPGHKSSGYDSGSGEDMVTYFNNIPQEFRPERDMSRRDSGISSTLDLDEAFLANYSSALEKYNNIVKSNDELDNYDT